MKLLSLLLALAGGAAASSTTSWEMTSYADFIKGRFQGIALGRDGELSLAPKLDTVFTSGQQVIWSVAQAPDGTLYAATGHRGKLYRIAPDGKASLLWTADQPEIFATALDGAGNLYAATSPDGRIYRIRNGAAEVYFDPHAKYIWTLAAGPDGALYAGTGEGGKVYRITGPNQGDEYYATGQSHVTGLTFDGKGRLLAGTEPNGILYRIIAKDKAFALYSAGLPEIRAIAAEADGSVYAAALGGSVARKTQAAAQGAAAMGAGSGIPTVTTSITVTAESAAAGPEVKPQPTQDPNKTASAAAAQANPSATATSSIEVAGVEKSAIYKIHPDNTVETLWSSKEENIYDLLPVDGRILFSTDGNGRIYGLDGEHHVALLAQTSDTEATRLLLTAQGVLAATGNMGHIFRLNSAASPRGSYESPVYDAGTIARWGQIRWPGSGGTSIQTRSGNSLRPDRTWSDWSAALSERDGAQIASPNARYLQWRVELAGAGATVTGVSVSYLPQNSAPVVRSILVTSSAAAAATPNKASIPTTAATAPYAITVTDTGDAAPATSTGTPTQTLSRAASQQLVITWQADDPEGDKLVYALWFRGEGEREWKLLKTNLHENTYAIEADALADGRYYFRVIASDREANPPAMAKQAELVSTPVLIDNTPPVITVRSAVRNGAEAEIEFSAVDAASALRRCEYSLDAANWVPVEAADGVIDSLSESFHLRLAGISAGEHLLVLRAVDAGGNTGLAKTVLR